jgi:hypothetical protein
MTTLRGFDVTAFVSDGRGIGLAQTSQARVRSSLFGSESSDCVESAGAMSGT